MKKISVSFVLFICLILSIFFALYSINYKVKNFGFSISPGKNIDVWLVEAKISFIPNNKPIDISLSAPKNKMIIGDIVNADNYIITKEDFKNKKLIKMQSPAKKSNKRENIYYKILLFDNKNIKYENRENSLKPTKPIEKPYYDESKMKSASLLLDLAKKEALEENINFITKLISLLNEKPARPEVKTFLPLKISQLEIFNIAKDLLSLENIPTRMVRGVKLIEGKNFQKPDLLLEAYVDNKWQIFNLENGTIGIPDNFLIFQNGGDSLLDIKGGQNSRIVFSVMKNRYNALFLSKYKAELNSTENVYKNSIYNLPISEQSMFKLMCVFPLAILAMVILKNIVGIKTLGTFTPMLIALAFIQTGLINGLLSFMLIVSIGLIIRHYLSRLNLLLVPRISSVVIFVILIMQYLAIISYNYNIQSGLSIVFFPLIVTAWIIERSSILIEESGEKEALKQNITTIIVAVLTYSVISSEKIRYIMYVFNELNIVILFLVMLIGTYTGYRFTELFRFKPLANGKKNA